MLFNVNRDIQRGYIPDVNEYLRPDENDVICGWT
jgi:hypothetical protein